MGNGLLPSCTYGRDPPTDGGPFTLCGFRLGHQFLASPGDLNSVAVLASDTSGNSVSVVNTTYNVVVGANDTMLVRRCFSP